MRSLQGACVGAKRQPSVLSHVVEVQGLPSSQLEGAPALHPPLAHLSPVVHAFPSSQGAVLGTFKQPDCGAQKSVVQGLPSSQVSPTSPLHTPASQLEVNVQGLPSSQAPFVGTNRQSPASQLAVVQGLPSSQETSGPAVQIPPLHISSVVQASPSEHPPSKSVY